MQAEIQSCGAAWRTKQKPTSSTEAQLAELKNHNLSGEVMTDWSQGKDDKSGNRKLL